MRCDIIIPIWNQKEITKNCIDSILRNTVYPHRLILIDNASDEDTKAYLESVRDIKKTGAILIQNRENLGFVKAVNQGLKIADAPYVCIFNNDTITTPGWLEEMVGFAEKNKDIGIVNPLCGGPAGMPKDEYARIIARDNKDKYMETNQCFLFCALVKKEVVEKIGYLDEIFGMGGFDDTDYSIRAGIAGYRCVCLHSAYVHHINNVSFKELGNRDLINKNCEKEFYKKWPKHLRVGVSISLSDDIKEGDLAGILKSLLYLAREWCWLNVWTFGNVDVNRGRVGKVCKIIKMPDHQNIKFNYFPHRFKDIRILTRLLERSFGTKKRKRYDAVIVDDEKTAGFLRLFQQIHKTMIWHIDMSGDIKDSINNFLRKFRNMNLQNFNETGTANG
jgi:GT2 family glycosyltransferase